MEIPSAGARAIEAVVGAAGEDGAEAGVAAVLAEVLSVVAARRGVGEMADLNPRGNRKVVSALFFAFGLIDFLLGAGWV